MKITGEFAKSCGIDWWTKSHADAAEENARNTAVPTIKLDNIVRLSINIDFVTTRLVGIPELKSSLVDFSNRP